MKEVFVLLDHCVGCKACELSCTVEHSISKSLFTAIFETPLPKRRIYVELGQERKIPITCRHCTEAPCIDACITGAMHCTPDGVVTNVEGTQKCIGCWMCLMVCLYGVVGRQIEPRIAVKCDLCPDRDTPVCVESCPTKALVYMEAEEFSRHLRLKLASNIAVALKG